MIFYYDIILISNMGTSTINEYKIKKLSAEKQVYGYFFQNFFIALVIF